MSIVIDQRLAPMTSPTNTVAYNVRHGVQWLPVAQARQLQMAQSTSLNGLKPPYGSQSAAQKGRSGLTALFYVSGLSLSTVCLFLWSRSKRKPARPA
jgi:hypothetical protein